MKLKHLLALAIIAVGGGSAWAQDVWKDVTSSYLQNADLDGDYTSLSKLNSTTLNSRTFQQPTGWSLYVSSVNTNDASFLTSNDNASSYTSNIASQITLPAKDEVNGDRKLVVRINNSGSNRRFELYQNVTLPVGSYKISGQFNNKSTGYMRTGVYYKSSDNADQRAQVTSSMSKDQWVTVEKTFKMSKEEYISVGFYFTQLNTNGWGIAAANDIKLEYNLTQALKDKISEASGIKITGDQSKYATALETAISNADNVKESQSESVIEQAITDLSSAMTTYNEKTDIINALINVRTEIARAEAYSVVKTENATAYAAAIQAAKNAIDEDNNVDYSSVILAMQNYKVEDYNYVTTTYTERKTVGSWTGAYQPTWISGAQHWSGATGNYSDNYENNMSRKGTQTISLPAGDYVFYAIGRSQETAMTYIKVGDVTTNFTPKGDVGLGVDKKGAANFTETADTYANNNKGRGWEYRFIPFHLDEATDVTLEFGYYYTTAGSVWASISEPMLYMTSATKVNNEIAAAKKALQDVINAAPSVAANVGDGAFQIPSATATTYLAAKTAAQTACDANDATVASLETAKTNLENAISTYQAVTLNAPTAGQKFNFVLKYDGWNYDNKAMTYIAGDRNDHGCYNIKYTAAANSNYAQAFTMTQVEGNKYKMSQADVDGNERYICTVTGGGYGNNNTSGLRTTTDVEKALVVEVIATTTEGIYNLKNTEANNYIGSQDEGVYTVNSHINFNITEATKASATCVVKAGKHGTFIAPFAAAIPSGVKAYTCEAHENGVLTLEEDKDGFDANTAYIIQNTKDSDISATLEGWGLALRETYTTGYLTGVYSDVKVPSGSYILATKDGEQAFYKVETSNYSAQANKCYITMPADASPVKALYFAEDADAIKTLEALTSNEAKIYDLNGRQLNSLQKGINIVNGRKVMVK